MSIACTGAACQCCAGLSRLPSVIHAVCLTCADTATKTRYRLGKEISRFPLRTPQTLSRLRPGVPLVGMKGFEPNMRLQTRRSFKAGSMTPASARIPFPRHIPVVAGLSRLSYESGWLQLCSWWDVVESNRQSQMTADLQSAPLPLTVYHPMFCRQIRIEVGLSLILLYQLSYLSLSRGQESNL